MEFRHVTRERVFCLSHWRRMALDGLEREKMEVGRGFEVRS